MANWSEILPYIMTGAGVGTSIYAANRAAGAVRDASAEATALDREIFEWQQRNLAPYQQTGENALAALNYGMGFQPGGFGGGVPGGQNALAVSDPILNFAGVTPRGSGVAGNALTGAGTGFAFGGPVGAGVGAAVGSATSLFGRGRKEADQIVPHQAALDRELERVRGLVESGQVSGPEAQQYMQGLQDDFFRMTQDFGRAGPGARDTIDLYHDPVLDQWGSMEARAGNALVPRGTDASPAQGLGFGEFLAPFQFETDPGYDFRLNEGVDAVTNSASATGSVLSGASLKALERYRQDYASNEYTNAFNRFQADRGNRFNQFSTLAGLGSTATGQANQAGGAFAGNAGQNALIAGQAGAGGILGTAGAINQGIEQGANLWQQRQIMNALAQGTAPRIPVTP
jgi:hypothetical protein